MGASGFLLGAKNEDDKLPNELKLLLKSPRSNDPTPPTEGGGVTLEGEEFGGDVITGGFISREGVTGEEEGCCCCREAW